MRSAELRAWDIRQFRRLMSEAAEIHNFTLRAVLPIGIEATLSGIVDGKRDLARGYARRILGCRPVVRPWDD